MEASNAFRMGAGFASGAEIAALLAVVDAAEGVLDEIDDYGEGDTTAVKRLRASIAHLASMRIEPEPEENLCPHCGHGSLPVHNAGGCTACGCTSPYGGTT